MDLRVLICARCAKVLSEGDRGTEISGSEVSQVGGHRFEVKGWRSNIGDKGSWIRCQFGVLGVSV